MLPRAPIFDSSPEGERKTVSATALCISFRPYSAKWLDPMIRYFFKKLFLKHKRLFFEEAQQISGFLSLLMKQRNTNEKWTEEERTLIKEHLKHLSMYIPGLLIFALPGGCILLPIFAEIMDRRRTRRLRHQEEMKAKEKVAEETEIKFPQNPLPMESSVLLVPLSPMLPQLAHQYPPPVEKDW